MAVLPARQVHSDLVPVPAGSRTARSWTRTQPLETTSSNNTFDRDFSTWESCPTDRRFCGPLQQPSLAGYRTADARPGAVRLLPVWHAPAPGIYLCTSHGSPATCVLLWRVADQYLMQTAQERDGPGGPAPCQPGVKVAQRKQGGCVFQAPVLRSTSPLVWHFNI